MGNIKEYVNGKVSDNREQIEYHVEKILELIGEDTGREGLLETPARVTRMYEEIFGGYSIDPREALGVTFDESHEELVIVKDIVYYSQCEHHMVPFFGSYDNFKKQFTEAANKVEGGGWAILVWSPRSHRLEILTAEKHQNLSQWDVVPLLALDVWEHAYYLKHQNNRADYINDWWKVVNWPYVSERYAAASKLVWKPY